VCVQCKAQVVSPTLFIAGFSAAAIMALMVFASTGGVLVCVCVFAGIGGVYVCVCSARHK